MERERAVVQTGDLIPGWKERETCSLGRSTSLVNTSTAVKEREFVFPTMEFRFSSSSQVRSKEDERRNMVIRGLNEGRKVGRT